MHENSKVGKFIVLKIGDYLLALPLSDVLRVVNCPSGDSSGLRSMGIVQLGRHTIRILDLHQRLEMQQRLAPTEGLSKLPSEQPFLAIARTPQGELCGILVDEPPNLIELPLDRMRSLPQSPDRSSILDLVSHTFVLSQEEVTTTIFLLDLKRVLHSDANALQPSSVTSSYTSALRP